MDSHERILVVGGGIFGTSTAYALGRSGHSRVEVLERDHLGSGATAYAAGILSLQTWNDADARLILRTRQLIEELVEWGLARDEAAARTVWHPVGGITIATPERASTLEGMRDRILRLGGSAEVMGGGEAAKRFPGFRFGKDERVLHGPADGYIESTDLVALIRARAKGMGVRFRESVGVDAVRQEGGRVRGVRFSDGSMERADRVVVAGGAWTRGVLGKSGLALPMVPYRTQLATLELAGADELPILHDTVHGFYARPESATRFLAGDGTQLRRFDPESFNRAADAEFIEATANRIVERFVKGGEARYRSGWAGLCVGTPDRRPLAGAMPRVDGLHILTGDNGFGLMRGLALGELVARGMGGGAPAGLAPMALDRFGPHQPMDDFPISEGFSFGDG